MRQGSVATYSVPTADIRTGNFSAYSTPIYDPLTGNPDGTGRTQFPGNIIPANRLECPLPRRFRHTTRCRTFQVGQTNNYFAQAVPGNDRDYTDGKVNYNLSEKSAIWGRYGRMWATSGGVGIFGDAVGPVPGGDPGLGDTVVQNMSAGHTYTFSPTVLLDGLFGYQRQNQTVTPSDYGKTFGTALGIPGLNGPDILQSGFPNINFADYRGLGRAELDAAAAHRRELHHQPQLDVDQGRPPNFRFGFDGVLLRLNHWQPELSAGGPRGYFDFGGG